MRRLLSLILSKLSLPSFGWYYGGGYGQQQDDSNLVFGLELTLTGAHCAVAFPNGTSTGLASIEGDAAYVELMQEWLKIATAKDGHLHARRSYPLPPHFIGQSEYVNQELQFSNPWWIDRMWRKMYSSVDWVPPNLALEDFHYDSATTILQDNLRTLRNKCFANLGGEWELDEPYAEVALPVWLYKDVPLYDQDVLGEYSDLRDHRQTTSTPFCSLTSRISTAIQHIGFTRSTFPTASDVEFAREYGGAWLMGPPSSPDMQATMSLKTLAHGGLAESAVVIVDLKTTKTLNVTSAWVTTTSKMQGRAYAGMADASIRGLWIRDTTQDLPLDALDAGNPELLSDAVEFLSSRIYENFSCPSTLILLTGDGTSRLIASPPDNPLLAAIGAAELAREECTPSPSTLPIATATFNMTRTHKATDRDHAGLANGTAAPEEHLPRYFAKEGFSGSNPQSVKKQGGGKGNWGQAGTSELEDYNYNMAKPKRRSNSSSMAAGHNMFKTKFEDTDPEALVEYDEDIHGPDQHELEKMSTSSSADTMGSVEEEDIKDTK
ncbi:hypothetical protein AC578_123 [Pseudocercospora eumusae]|uniref:Uncharacterized protein n=1 Tax=Pseudocercospora eumusae TaxID=321146 RepID=A0A139HP93_9PEZI|nr:hypothetical protein AC578_123 [Pseudocercospora eumusae]